MPIRDNPSFKDLEDHVRGFGYLYRMRPVFRLFGKNGKAAAAALDAFPEMSQKTHLLVSLPDRFNDLYLERGWVADERLATTTMEEAVELANSGDLDSGEQLLASSLSKETIQWQLRGMRRIDTFRNRERLLTLAVEDHFAERYHASVPVLLAQIDGITLDLTGKTLYEQREKKLRELIVEDSIVGHPEGIVKLASTVLTKRAHKTTDDALSAPNRNAILHGRSLGYDTELISAKCIRLLLALGSLAVKLDEARLKNLALVPPQEPEAIGWREAIAKVQEANDRTIQYVEFPESLDLDATGEAADQGSATGIPGIPTRQVAKVLDSLGFDCRPPSRGMTELRWVCRLKTRSAEYEVAFNGIDEHHIRSINASVFDYGTELTGDAAKSFLGFIATVPYAGADPVQARCWVHEHVGTEAEIKVSGSTFSLFGSEKFIHLDIVSQALE